MHRVMPMHSLLSLMRKIDAIWMDRVRIVPDRIALPRGSAQDGVTDNLLLVGYRVRAPFSRFLTHLMATLVAVRCFLLLQRGGDARRLTLYHQSITEEANKNG